MPISFSVPEVLGRTLLIHVGMAMGASQGTQFGHFC